MRDGDAVVVVGLGQAYYDSGWTTIMSSQVKNFSPIFFFNLSAPNSREISEARCPGTKIFFDK